MHLYQLIKEKYNLTRSEVKSFFKDNIITINQQVASNMSMDVSDKDIIYINNQQIFYSNVTKRYILFYKPVGVICTNDKSIANNIMSYFMDNERLFTIGRLDKESEGLIILTNDGGLFNKVINGKLHVEKEYEVIVDKKINDEFIISMSSGIKIKDRITKKCLVNKTGEYNFAIVLTEGLNRQIRRMCLALGYKVISLKRVRIKNISNDLKAGESRDLTRVELEDLLG